MVDPGNKKSKKSKAKTKPATQGDTPQETPIEIPQVNNGANPLPMEGPQTDLERQEAQLEGGLYTYKYYLENTFPRNLISNPAHRVHAIPDIPREFSIPGPNDKNAKFNKIFCNYIGDINSYYREDNRRYQEQSRDNMIRDVASMLTPIRAQMDKMSGGLAMLVTQSAIAQSDTTTELETLKSLITKLG